MIENAKNALEKRWLLHWRTYFFETTAVLALFGLRPYQSYNQSFGSNYCINIIKVLFQTKFPSVVQETLFLLFCNRKTNSPNPPPPAGGYTARFKKMDSVSYIYIS
jgi:hypothetical protein